MALNHAIVACLRGQVPAEIEFGSYEDFGARSARYFHCSNSLQLPLRRFCVDYVNNRNLMFLLFSMIEF